MPRVVTLTSDFGTADGYVGEMKGALLTQVPDVTIIDITHDIEPQDVQSARLLVERCWECFPAGTVHVVVVDPGVGSARAAMAVASRERFLFGPDNGVLSAALDASGAQAVVLPVPPEASATFHGRDVFIPAAARLLTGTPFPALGQRLKDPVVHREPEPLLLPGGGLVGEVVHADRFGNAVTSLRPEAEGGPWVVEAAGRRLRFVRTYADAAVGEALALIGSSGRLEVAVRNGHASRTLGLARGARVTFRRAADVDTAPSS
jgi:hypothetical protein